MNHNSPEVTTDLSTGLWWEEDDQGFYVEYSGGAVVQRFQKQTPQTCREVSWYSQNSSNRDFERCTLPFGLDWEITIHELHERLAAPSRNRGRIFWYDYLCAYEVSLLFANDGKLYWLKVDMDHTPTDPLELYRPSLLERVYELFLKKE